MKTYESIKWGKGYYLMTREHGMAKDRVWIKTKTELNDRIKFLKRQGYVAA